MHDGEIQMTVAIKVGDRNSERIRRRGKIFAREISAAVAKQLRSFRTFAWWCPVLTLRRFASLRLCVRLPFAAGPVHAKAQRRKENRKVGHYPLSQRLFGQSPLRRILTASNFRSFYVDD